MIATKTKQPGPMSMRSLNVAHVDHLTKAPEDVNASLPSRKSKGRELRNRDPVEGRATGQSTIKKTEGERKTRLERLHDSSPSYFYRLLHFQNVSAVIHL